MRWRWERASVRSWVMLFEPGGGVGGVIIVIVLVGSWRWSWAGPSEPRRPSDPWTLTALWP